MVNAYLVEDVLVDAGTRSARKRITRQLDGRTIAAHVVTHAHPDHFGSSHAVCERYDVPLWTGAKDVEAITTATPVPAPGFAASLLSRMKMPPPHPVARAWPRATRSPGSPCWTCPATRPVTSLCGATTTAC